MVGLISRMRGRWGMRRPSGWLASSRAPQPQHQGDGHLECGGVEMRARGNVGRVQHGFAHLFDLQADRGAGVVPMAVQVFGVRNGVALAVEPEIADPAERMADRMDVAAQHAAAWPGHAPQFGQASRSEEHTSELQSLMRISYAVFCLKKKKT